MSVTQLDVNLLGKPVSSPEFWFTIVALQGIVSSAQGQSWSKIITPVRWYCSIWIIISDLKKSWAGRVLMFNYKSKQMKLSLKEEGRRQFLRRLRLWILAVEKLMLNCTAGSKRWNYTNHVWMMWKIVLLCFIIYHFLKYIISLHCRLEFVQRSSRRSMKSCDAGRVSYCQWDWKVAEISMYIEFLTFYQINEQIKCMWYSIQYSWYSINGWKSGKRINNFQHTLTPNYSLYEKGKKLMV